MPHTPVYVKYWTFLRQTRPHHIEQAEPFMVQLSLWPYQVQICTEVKIIGCICASFVSQLLLISHLVCVQRKITTGKHRNIR